MPFLRRAGIRRVDLVALSHPHPDHMDGLAALLGRVPVGALWATRDAGGGEALRRLLALAEARGIPTPTPAPMPLGRLRLEPLGPFDGPGVAAVDGLSVNDNSLSLRVGLEGAWILFPGDLEEDGETELVGRIRAGLAPAGASILKVPHHGSRTSSTDDLLATVRPRLAVVSLGRRNRFGFPHAEVIERYAAHGVPLLRTDLCGGITVTLGPSRPPLIVTSVPCNRGSL